MHRATILSLIALVGLVLDGTFAHPSAGAAESPLTDADRRAFAWFDGISGPSCAGKKYVRVTWTRKDPPADAPPAERLWEIDGFLLAEDTKLRTILDADQIARKIERSPREWTDSMATLALADVAAAAAGRLRAIVSDPGAVQPVEDVFHGVKKLVGDEGHALALARHCAANKLEAGAHELLEAARALPPAPGEKPAASIEAAAAAQYATPFMRRLYNDFADAGIPRARLLERFRGWRRSFPSSEHLARAEDAIRGLEPMVKEETGRRVPSDADLAKLPPAARAKELVFRLRDQVADVWVSRRGDARLDLDGKDGPVDRVVAMGHDAVPALIDAVTDARFARAPLFRLDETLDRQFIARVGDMAQFALERISEKEFRKMTAEASSMFQDDSAAGVQKQWREWWDEVSAFPALLAKIAAEPDAVKRAALARELPDRGPGRLPGAADAAWGTKAVAAALPKAAPDAVKAMLRSILAESPHPRTRSLAAWALLDLGDADAVPSMIALWNDLDDAARADPVQGGAVISFLTACGHPEAAAALADHLDDRAPAVRELAVLSLLDRGLGPVRGFAADSPDGVNEKWSLTGVASDAVEDLVASRLTDLVEDPLGRIPRQLPMCDLVPSYDCGRRIADAAIRVMAQRWPATYPLRDEPVRSDTEWEETRLRFLETWKTARAARPAR